MLETFLAVTLALGLREVYAEVRASFTRERAVRSLEAFYESSKERYEAAKDNEMKLKTKPVATNNPEDEEWKHLDR